jgi:hypothetical protein
MPPSLGEFVTAPVAFTTARFPIDRSEAATEKTVVYFLAAVLDMIISEPPYEKAFSSASAASFAALDVTARGQ